MQTEPNPAPEAATSKNGRYLSITCKRCGALPASREEREHIYEELFCFDCSKPLDVDVDD
jgi:hypothetical protein